MRFPGSIETNATAINVTGEVAGDYEKGPSDKTFGFVYSDGTYSTINIPGSVDTFVTGINASGDVTGYYYTNSATYGFIATPQTSGPLISTAIAAVPEPSTWALLLVGFAGLGFAGCRKASSERTAGCAA